MSKGQLEKEEIEDQLENEEKVKTSLKRRKRRRDKMQTKRTCFYSADLEGLIDRRMTHVSSKCW